MTNNTYEWTKTTKESQPTSYTELTCNVVDYEGLERTVTIRDPGWDLNIESLNDMFQRLLQGLGFSDKTIKEFYGDDE